VIYLVFDRWLETEPLVKGEAKETALEIIQGYFHLWFLYRLAEVYVMVPILRAVTKEKKLILYFLCFSFVVGILVPTYKQFPIRSTDTIADNGINLDITIGYAGYMVAGYALHRYNLAKKWKQLIYLLGIVGFIITIGGTSLVSIKQGKQYPLFYEYLTPNIMASALAAFLLIKEKFKEKEFSAEQKKKLSLLSKY